MLTSNVIKKAAKRLYFLVQLKRANVSRKDLCLFYSACIRSVIDYAVPVFHFALPTYLSHQLECIQIRALRIICPGLGYHDALANTRLPSIAEHHDKICERMFHNIITNNDNKLRRLLPPKNDNHYNLRSARTFTLPRTKTNRFNNSFLMASCIRFGSF